MPTTFRLPTRIALVGIISILAVAGCSSGDAITKAGTTSTAAASTQAPKKHVVVHIRDYAFVPAKTTVAPGATITFVNDDEVAHTGTDPKGAFDTGNLAPGTSKTVTVKATTVGAVPYLCSIHQFMTGSITVVK
jgi:plastocyanin